MKCRECPLHLSCIAGRIKTNLSLCVKCARVSFLLGRYIYVFKCEERVLTTEIIRLYHSKQHIPWLPDVDVRDFQYHPMSIATCLWCINTSRTREMIKRLKTRYLDDELEEAKEKANVPVFKLNDGLH